MVSEDETRGGMESDKRGFEARDLLVGRPEGPATAPSAVAEQARSVPPTMKPDVHEDAHDDAIREILATVQALAAAP